MKKIISAIKKQKFYYYSSNIVPLLVPHIFYRIQLNYWMKQVTKYPKEYLESRVNYYINTSKNQKITNATALKNFITPEGNSYYFFDLAQITKYFSKKLSIKYLFGDITENQNELTIVKSRPINQNGNSVLMKLDKLRHFNFINDTIPFEEKKDIAVWRGWFCNEKRELLVDKFSNNPICDIKEADSKKESFKDNFMSIDKQLEYKFIISIEGIDVATNLKWILNSNSLCFMPKPVYETWFMEGKLIPNHHYVLLKDDFSDLIEKINFYSNNPDKAIKIIKNANKWTAQFKDKKLEKILSLLVLQSYFKKTNQIVNN